MSIEAKRTKRLLAGVLAGALALSVTPILGLTGTAGAAHEPATGDGSVCEDAPGTEPFTDVTDADPAQAEIECLFNTGITVGTSATTYSPNANVQRRQMALFLVRLADVLEEAETSEASITALPEGDGVTAFTDIAAENEETQDAIDRLNDAGIALGTTATTFSPGDQVTREQMAAFIVRLQEFVAGEAATPDNAPDAFTDDENSFAEEELNILAAEGVYLGVGNGEVNPGDPITRRQMARVIIRKAQYMFEEGFIGRLFADAGQATATTRPELVSAAVVRTTSLTQVSPGNDQGLTVQYCFDEPVTGNTPVSTAFYIYPNDSDSERADGAASIDPTNNRCVNVFFAGAQYDTPAEAAALTLAAVDDGAVTDGSGDTNPEGDSPLGSGGSTTVAAGVTSAPDLLSVSNFRQGSTVDLTAVDFTFDENAFVLSTTGFHLVLTSGDVVACTASSDATVPSGGTVPGGSGTATITVVCDDADAGQLAGNAAFITSAEVARGYVDEDAVADAAALGNTNALQAADVSNSGNSLDPDLVSAVFQPDSTANVDQVLYTFDEPVRTAVTAGNFCIYYTNGADLCGTSAERSPTNDTQVLVTFGDGTLTDAVGANVLPAAVTEITSAGSRTNDSDEVAVAPTSNTTVTAGRTDGPDLTNVVLSQATDAFGVTRTVATYVFDEDTSDAAPTPGDFHLYLSDGTQLDCQLISPANQADRTEDLDNTVTCVSFALATTGTATNTQVSNAVLGTVDHGAVVDETTGSSNPIGAELTSGGTGTPQQ